MIKPYTAVGLIPTVRGIRKRKDIKINLEHLHHLVKADEILGQVLLSWHNIAFFQHLMGHLRSAIAEERLDQFRREFAARQSKVTS